MVGTRVGAITIKSYRIILGNELTAHEEFLVFPEDLVNCFASICTMEFTFAILKFPKHAGTFSPFFEPRTAEQPKVGITGNGTIRSSWFHITCEYTKTETDNEHRQCCSAVSPTKVTKVKLRAAKF